MAEVQIQRGKNLENRPMADEIAQIDASAEKTMRQTQSASSDSGKQPQKSSQSTTGQARSAKSGQPSKSSTKAISATKPAASTAKSPATDVVSFNKEALLILREMNSNITQTNSEVKELRSKVDALYDPEYDEPDYDDNDHNDDYFSETPEENESVSDSYSTKRPHDEENIFSSFAKKFRKSDLTDRPVNQGLADLVNSAFLEGMSDDNFNDIIKNIHRPENCESLKETRVNPGVWSVLRAQTQTEDSKLRGIQNCVVKATCKITKLMDAQGENLDETSLETGMNALGPLGQANKWLNIRRRETHKKDMDPKLHHLCSASVPYTDLLYGDSIVKDIRDIQEMNKISKNVGSTRQSGFRGRGTRGARFPRSRGRGIRRGGYRYPSNPNQPSKNGKADQSKHKGQ